METRSNNTTRQHVSQLLHLNKRHALYLGILASLALVVAMLVPLELRSRGMAMTHEETVLDCHYAGVAAHTHTSDCFDAEGTLVCPLPERELHVHDDGCYAEERVLACGLEEGEDHQHTDACYETTRTLICDKEEIAEEHVHGPGCFQTITVADDPASAQGGEAAQVLEGAIEREDGTLYAKVAVEAPAGALPAGSTMKAELVDDEVVRPAIEDELAQAGDDVVAELQAMQITFADAEGNEAIPVSPVLVRLTSELVSRYDEPLVMVIDNEVKATQVATLDEQALAERELVAAEDEILFEAQDVKVLVLVGTQAPEPAGEPELEATELVEATAESESQEPTDPNLTTPELVTEPTSELADAPVATEDEQDAAPAEDTADNASATEQVLSFENDALQVTATVRGEALPEGATLAVTPITPATEGYNYDAYMQALAQTTESAPTAQNTLLYDVAIMVDSIEWEPSEGGKIDLAIAFKDSQLTEQIGVEDPDTISVVHLPIDAEVMAQYDSTKAATDITSTDIVPETVDATITADAENVAFEVTSLSTIAITNQASTVNLSVQLTGSYDAQGMQLSQKNTYAYLVPVSGSGRVYGAKLNFSEGGLAQATITNVPKPNVDGNTQFKLILAYKTDGQTLDVNDKETNYLVPSNNVVQVADGGYFFGFTYHEPTTYAQDGNTYTVAASAELLKTTTSDLSVASLMDHAIAYGVTARSVYQGAQARTNFATNDLNFQNPNEGEYGNRCANDLSVPNIITSFSGFGSGQKLNSKDHPSTYYIREEDADKVNANHTGIVRNPHELSDKVDLLITRTLDQCGTLASNATLELPAISEIDLTAYPDGETIYLDADNINNIDKDTLIVKKPNQKVVFTYSGTNVTLPKSLCIKVVDPTTGEALRRVTAMEGNKDFNGEQYVGARDAVASDGDIWNKVIFNCVNATEVKSNNAAGGIILVPQANSVTTMDHGCGWIVSNGTVNLTNEWYAFPGEDEPFERIKVYKVFTGLDEVDVAKVNKDFVISLDTLPNGYVAGQEVHKTGTMENIEHFVIDPDSTQTTPTLPLAGYPVVDENAGTITYCWESDYLAVGNEHTLFEDNATYDGADPSHVTIQTRLIVIDHAAGIFGWTDSVVEGNMDVVGVLNVSNNVEANNHATITNMYHEPTHFDLNVTKKVVDPGHKADASAAYTINIELTGLKDANEQPITSDTFEATLVRYGGQGQGAAMPEETLTFTKDESSGTVTYKAQITLPAAQRARLVQLPKDCTYSVSEVVPADAAFEATYDGKQAGTLTSNASTTITNTYQSDVRDVVVTKTVMDASYASMLQSQGFALHVNNKNVRTDAHLLKMDDAGVAVTTVPGGVRYEWKVEGLHIGHEYLVSESSADILGYLRTSTIAIDGEAAHSIGRAETITIKELDEYTNDQRVDFTNTYVPVPNPATVPLKAEKVFLDADNNSLSLTAGQFAFVAEEWDVDAKSVVAGGRNMTSGNEENGLIDFGDEDFEPGTTTYFLLSEHMGSDEAINYSVEKYIAKVEVPEASSVDATYTIDGGTVSVTFATEAGGLYRLLREPNNMYNYVCTDTASGSQTTFTFDGAQDVTYYIAKLDTNEWGMTGTGAVLYSVHVTGNYNTGYLAVDSVEIAGAGSGAASASDPVVTYYELNTYSNTFDESKPLSSIPIFTNKLKPADDQQIRILKVGYDNTAATEQDYPLAGATFAVYQADDEWTKGDVVDGMDALVSAVGTGLVYEGTLPTGKYLVEETDAPDGYYGLSGCIKLEVSSTGIVASPGFVGGEDAHYTFAKDDATGAYVLTVKNATGTVLPAAGGSGVEAFTLVGLLVMFAASIALLVRRMILAQR